MTAPDPSELLSATEVAEITGLGRKTIHGYHARGQMPAPYVVLGCGPIWLRSEIEEWHFDRPRRRRTPADLTADTLTPE